MTEPFLPGTARPAAVRVVECGDPLVDVATVSSLSVAARSEAAPGPFLRGALVDRLVTAGRCCRRKSASRWSPASARRPSSNVTRAGRCRRPPTRRSSGCGAGPAAPRSGGAPLRVGTICT